MGFGIYCVLFSLLLFFMTDQELFSHLDLVSADYVGTYAELSQAIGAVYLARLYGWRVLRIVISSKVYARHERVLGLKFKDIFPESTDLSRKSLGYSIALKMDAFWELVRGHRAIDPKERVSLI